MTITGKYLMKVQGWIKLYSREFRFTYERKKYCNTKVPIHFPSIHIGYREDCRLNYQDVYTEVISRDLAKKNYLKEM
jgi:hypothetical protein